MSEMVERVARALADCAMEPFDEISREKFIGDARAVIKAMREPTPQMIEEAWAAALNEDAKGVWRDMIETALGNPPHR